MDSAPSIRVLSVDDHPLFREGIAAVIGGQPDMTLVAQASTGREAIQLFTQHLPDVTLMDLRLPDLSGIEVMAAIRAEYPNARVLMLTTSEGDVEVRRALSAGARGWILKTTAPRALADVIRSVHAGHKRMTPDVADHLAEHFNDDLLTERERRVLELVARGNSNRDIGLQLTISEGTVKVHVKHILEKLGAGDRTEAVTIAVRRGIIYL